MELELSRIDYTFVGITGPNCLKLLPPNVQKDQQKVAVADKDGILQVFSVKKDDIQIHFKTLPGPEISCLRTAGATGTLSDRIFIAAANEVKGYTKKGKLFLNFDSGMTEPIMSMSVLGSDLFLCGKHAFNHYRDCKDVGSYLCGDRIVDVLAYFSQTNRRLIALIACEGRMIRVLEHARVTFSIEVDSSPTILYLHEDEDLKVILFGTIDGRIGILNIEMQTFDRWLLTNEKNSGCISCMDSYDLTNSGNKNLIVGREDGTIEVFTVHYNDNSIDSPTCIFSINCNESITALQCGVVGCLNYDEILVATYTGRIFGLTTQVIDSNVDSAGNFIVSAERNLKLKSEIEELKEKVLKEREKYQMSTASFFDEVSAIPILPVKDSFLLCKETSTYSLTIEVATAIDNILLQSNVVVHLLDVEKNSAVVSYSQKDPLNENYLLATYRCQINTNRLELKVRTIEGQSGILHAYVTPLVQPKCSRLLKYEIKALSLHFRIHNFDFKRPFNTLNIKGSFSLAEVHSWIGLCLPEVPIKPQVIEKTVYWFQSSLLQTILQCSYQKGEIEFISDNVSTITTLKDFITKEATKKKIKVEINTSINDESIGFVLKMVDEELMRQQKLVKDLALLNALMELEVTQEETSKYLSEKYKAILANETQIRKAVQDHPGSLDRLHGALTDLYVDYNKFKGFNVKSKMNQFAEALENYSLETLIKYFQPHKTD